MAWIGLVVCCWVLADFLSGLGHWWEDRYAREEWPIIGPLVATPNQHHHAHPSDMGRSYWERNAVTVAIAAAGALMLYAACGPTPWLLALLFVSQSNEVHYWTHSRRGPFVRALQATGIVQPPRQHGEHHHAPFNCRYCVMSGWLNPLLDLIGFWQLVERTAWMVLGIRPAR